MRNAGHSRLNQQINEEAARWFVELRTGDLHARGRLEFDAWVRASPEHLRAFVEIAGLWKYAADVSSRDSFSTEALIADAAAEGNIHLLEAKSIPAATPSPQSIERAPRLRRSAAFKIAASVLIVITASIVAWSHFAGKQVFTTQVGEERLLRLTDGSTLTLNSRSRVQVEFTKSARTVDLLEGEALFRVAKNPARPFVVRADGTSVRVIGTEFDVNKKFSGTFVTVVEGKVAVVANPAEAVHSGPSAVQPPGKEAPGARAQETARHENNPAVILSAGEQIKVARGAAPQPTRTDVSSTTAWTRGRVILDSATLEEIADEFNRYSERRLTAEDHGEIPLRLSGIFSTDPDFLLDDLRGRPDIHVSVTETEIRIVRE